MISFKTTKGEHQTIVAIADRAAAMALRYESEYDRKEAMMDVTAAHANGCRLKLDELLAAEPLDFVHDVFGIRRHINRTNGQLEDHFLPRFAR